MDQQQQLLLWQWSSAVQVTSLAMIAAFFALLARFNPRAELRWWALAWLANLVALSVTLAYWYFQPPQAMLPVVRAGYMASKLTFVLLLIQGGWTMMRPGARLLGTKPLAAVVTAYGVAAAALLAGTNQIGVVNSLVMTFLLGGFAFAFLRSETEELTWFAAGLSIRAVLAGAEAIAYMLQLLPADWALTAWRATAAQFLSVSSSFDTGVEWLVVLGCVLAVSARKFFREQYDARLLLTRVMDSDFISQDPAGIASGLANEIDRSLHASVDLFVADATRARLVDPRGSGRHLPADSTLVKLAMADLHPMRLDVGPDSVLNRLPASEKAWVTSGGYQLIAGLRTRSGDPAGLLALGEKQSGLSYSDADRQSIGALSGPLTLTLEHHRLRNTSDPPVDRAARECLACSRLHDPDAVDCTCGEVLAQGHAPHVLRGTFRFEQRIGAGGMGVVYRAVDMSLGRDVAIKTLPKVTSDHVTRLRREAQAMASLQHPNLAVIYGIETWQGIPFLVEEYLPGGTLANRLSAAPLGIGEAIELGITLAAVLETLHGSGIIHCDIKPSNIGYTRAGTPKLLDFGLVHMLRRSGDGNLTSTTVTSDRPPDVSGFIATDRGLMGTPPYMSPEAIRAHQPAPPVDLWALSVVLYESIGGRRPFEGPDAQEIFRQVGAGKFPGLQTLRENCRDEVARFFTNAFSPDPSQRPQDAKGFKTELMALRSVET